LIAEVRVYTNATVSARPECRFAGLLREQRTYSLDGKPDPRGCRWHGQLQVSIPCPPARADRSRLPGLRQRRCRPNTNVVLATGMTVTNVVVRLRRLGLPISPPPAPGCHRPRRSPFPGCLPGRPSPSLVQGGCHHRVDQRGALASWPDFTGNGYNALRARSASSQAT